MNIQTRDQTYIFRSEIAHEHTSHRPIDHVHARDVARTDAHVKAFVFAGCQQAWQIGRRMAEVGIHLENIVIALLESPFEASNIRRAKSQLARTFDEEQTVLELFSHQAFHDGGCAVG